MRQLRIACTILALAIGAVSIGTAEAAPSSHCSQVYFRAHTACMKQNSQDACRRLIGPRMDACMKTGCWSNSRGKRCGLVRL